MGKFDNRINSLIKKTHGFLSHEDLCAIRDYFQESFEIVPKSDVFDHRARELESLQEEFRKKSDPNILGRFREVLSSEPAIWLKAVIPDFVSYCDTSEWTLDEG